MRQREKVKRAVRDMESVLKDRKSRLTFAAEIFRLFLLLQGMQRDDLVFAAALQEEEQQWTSKHTTTVSVQSD